MIHFLEDDLAKDVLTWKDEHAFSQPTAARHLLGVLAYINEFSESDIESVHSMAEKETLLVFFNCHASSIREILKNPVDRHNSEFSFA